MLLPRLALRFAMHHASCDDAHSTSFLWTWADTCAGADELPPSPIIDHTIYESVKDALAGEAAWHGQTRCFMPVAALGFSWSCYRRANSARRCAAAGEGDVTVAPDGGRDRERDDFFSFSFLISRVGPTCKRGQC